MCQNCKNRERLNKKIAKIMRCSLFTSRGIYVSDERGCAGYEKNGEIKTFDEWKRCASLAIVCNNYKAGQHRIFNSQNDRHLQVSDRVYTVNHRLTHIYNLDAVPPIQVV